MEIENIKFLNTENIKSVLSYANTPSYVYKNLRADKSILNFSNQYDSAKLIEEFDELYRKEEKNNEDWIMIYALLFSMLAKSDIESLKFLRDNSDEYTIKWFKGIVNFHLSSFVNTNNLNYNIQL